MQFRFNDDCVLEDGFKDHLKRCWEMNLSYKLSEVNGEELSEKVLAKITEDKLMLNLEAVREELFWEQRVRVNWLRMGDRNTSFFQSFASSRKRMNVVKGLEDRNGACVSGEEEMVGLATGYFKDLLS